MTTPPGVKELFRRANNLLPEGQPPESVGARYAISIIRVATTNREKSMFDRVLRLVATGHFFIEAEARDSIRAALYSSSYALQQELLLAVDSLRRRRNLLMHGVTPSERDEPWEVSLANRHHAR